ncbi:MAG: AtpZ/AtpI family protein [Fibrobacterota bacterium]|nr:AtpZ/AtpI family protein [Fibrobacterota bacterium]QQS06307.1 MAG: AtpZ/AtpI family protein [Fibrobacterota bacterium]
MVLGSAFIGYWLSARFHSQWILVVSCLLGVIVALWRMIRILSRP